MLKHMHTHTHSCTHLHTHTCTPINLYIYDVKEERRLFGKKRGLAKEERERRRQLGSKYTTQLNENASMKPTTLHNEDTIIK